MSQIIFYGVGNSLRQFANEFVAKAGMPVCLSDRHKEKQTQFVFPSGEVRDVLPIEEVMKRYPDYEIWLTLASHNLGPCYHELTAKGVNSERINFFGDKEYRLGCQYLDSYSYIHSASCSVCCHFPYATNLAFEQDVLSEEDIRHQLEKLETWRTGIIGKLRRGEKTPCDGCPSLKLGFYSQKPCVTWAVVGPKFSGGTRCNCNCFYCNQFETMKQPSRQVLSNYDVHRIAADYYGSVENTILADGEPTLGTDADKLFDMIRERKWTFTLNTNGILYSDRAAEALAQTKCSVLVLSLDSGTRETYKKIKRVDKYDQVVENLRKYRDTGCVMILKYIMIPNYNDNLADINGFIEVAKDIRVSKVVLSQNLSGFFDGKIQQGEANMPETLFASFAYMIARLQEESLSWEFQIEFISEHDRERIEKLRIC